MCAGNRSLAARAVSTVIRRETASAFRKTIMGYKNIETTVDIYAEATDRKKEETFANLAAKLDELF